MGFTFVFVPKVVENLRDRYKVLSHVFYMLVSNRKTPWDTAAQITKTIMKKLFVSTLFISLSVVALADSPMTNTVAGNDCRDRGVSVQKDNNSVRVRSNANTDYNLRVTTGNGNSYEYDTRNSTTQNKICLLYTSDAADEQ